MDTLKKFLQVLLLACCCVFVIKNDAVEASHNVYPEFQSLAAVKVNRVHRTAFHFQPPSNWINGWYWYYFGWSILELSKMMMIFKFGFCFFHLHNIACCITSLITRLLMNIEPSKHFPKQKKTSKHAIMKRRLQALIFCFAVVFKLSRLSFLSFW